MGSTSTRESEKGSGRLVAGSRKKSDPTHSSSLRYACIVWNIERFSEAHHDPPNSRLGMSALFLPCKSGDNDAYLRVEQAEARRIIQVGPTLECRFDCWSKMSSSGNEELILLELEG